MALLDPLFGSAAMDEVFGDSVRLQRMLDFEAALAKAEAACGVIPGTAAPVIASRCKVELLDVRALAAATALSLNPAIPLVKQLTTLVAADDAKAAGFVHWGATSQDVNDTGLVLQIRQGLDILEADLTSLSHSLIELARKHRSTPIVGRTLMQHAVPTTFGAKVAGWLDAVTRHRERLAQTRKRVLVLQFGGAVGTLAALRGKSLEVAEVLAAELHLELPAAPWHTQRDRIAEVATTLGLCVGTLGKIARDIALHMQTEIAELFEPAGEGRGGSSTMPHKRNPVSAGVVLAAATRVPGLVSTMLTAMVQEDERGLGNWHAEWETVPELFRLTAGALHQMAMIVPHLQVDGECMRRNLDATQGLIFAEGVTMALADQIGKSAAHKLVEEASQKARASGQHLREILAQDKSVIERLKAADLDRLFAPENCLGAAEEFVDRVIAASAPHG
ncbi:MAG TPA: 3-carboxy-cis,cis-muconate cycloisomerase [Terriglobales bacterium]|nr:3-carboxy-cis,cis-muconate cycloisomerase [Terriglobales bacterium]